MAAKHSSSAFIGHSQVTFFYVHTGGLLIHVHTDVPLDWVDVLAMEYMIGS